MPEVIDMFSYVLLQAMLIGNACVNIFASQVNKGPANQQGEVCA